MNNYRKAILSILIVSVMVLSSFAFFIPTTTAQVAPPQPVGTVTLNPSSGAFPGQLVYFTWSGVPTDLVAPVYVTVLLNGSAYTTAVASYSGSTLSGSFLMPNDNPGTSFTVSFQYMDSAHNAGTQTAGSGAAPITLSATEAGMNPSNQTVTTFTSPYHVFGNTTYGAKKVGSIYADSAASNGTSVLKTNDTGVALSSNTTLTNSTTPQGVQLNGFTNFTGTGAFYGNSSQKTFVNATSYNAGPASLALPTPVGVTSSFHFSKVASNTITSIVTTFYINTSVSGTPVSFRFTGTYSATITSAGTYTMSGTFAALEPQSLTSLGGTFSAAYAIQSFSWNYHNGNSFVNYTLSITFTGSTTISGNTVSVHAQYTNSTVNKNTSVTSYYLNATDSLVLQGGYSFTSTIVGLENPGFSGSYLFKYTDAYLPASTGNVTFSFSNFASGAISVLQTKSIYLNVSKIAVTGFNESVSGPFNMTINTVSYTPGVFAIAQANWTFDILYTFHFKGTNLYIAGSITQTTKWLNNSAAISSFVDNVGNFSIMTNSNMTGTLGYLQLTGITLLQDSFNLVYGSASATITAQQETMTTSSELTALGIYSFSGKRTVTGFNESLPSGTNSVLHLKVNTMIPVVYAVTTSGYDNFTWNYSLFANDSAHHIVVEDHIGGALTYPTSPYSNTTFMVTPSVYLFKSNSDFKVYLSDFTGTVNSATFTSTLTSVFDEYSGTIVTSGAGNNSKVNVDILVSNNFKMDGNVTSLAGYANDSMKAFFNATVTFTAVNYALYGISNFNGWANYTFAGTIQKKGPNTDYPYFTGTIDTAGSYIPLTSTLVTRTYSTTGVYTSSSLTVTSNETPVLLSGVSFSGMFTVTDPLFGYTNTFAYYTNVTNIASSPSLVTQSLTVYPYQVSGDQNMSTYTYYSYPYFTVNSYIGAPFANVTLQPTVNISFNSEQDYVNTSWNSLANGEYYYEDAASNTPYFALNYFGGSFIEPLNLAINGSDSHSGTASGFSTQTVFQVFSYNVNLNTNIGGMTVTTSSVEISQAGNYYFTGTAVGPNGSGTVTGVIDAQTLFPSYVQNNTYFQNDYYQVNLNQSMLLSATINVFGTYANGTQFSTTVTLPASMVMVHAEAGYYDFYYFYYEGYLGAPFPAVYNQVSLSGSYSSSNLVQTANTGSVTYGSFALVNGAGAFVVSISNSQIAEIATQAGADINITLAQLNAKVSSIWTLDNTTYATLNTDFGTMNAQLTAIGAQLTNVTNGVATMETDLGTIQTSLASINAQITSINGTVVSLQTSAGNIQTSLSGIDAKVTAINGTTATISTAVGNIQGQVTALNGTTATIKTNLGTLTTTVNGINTKVGTVGSSVGNTEIFEIVVLVLVLITLVLAFLSMNNVNKLSKKLEEQKKQ